MPLAVAKRSPLLVRLTTKSRENPLAAVISVKRVIPMTSAAIIEKHFGGQPYHRDTSRRLDERTERLPISS